jgi:hypothetical protein
MKMFTIRPHLLPLLQPQHLEATSVSQATTRLTLGSLRHPVECPISMQHSPNTLHPAVNTLLHPIRQGTIPPLSLRLQAMFLRKAHRRITMKPLLPARTLIRTRHGLAGQMKM